MFKYNSGKTNNEFITSPVTSYRRVRKKKDARNLSCTVWPLVMVRKTTSVKANDKFKGSCSRLIKKCLVLVSKCFQIFLNSVQSQVQKRTQGGR